MTESNVQPFEFRGNPVATVTTGNGTVLFCAKHVATALGYKRPADAVKQHCKGSVIRRPLETAGGIQQMVFITEGDVYRLIASSKLTSAVEFEHWLFDEVVPQIRRTGGYSVRPAQRPTLPAPKFRPDFIEWKQAVCRYLNRNDLKTVATNMKVTYSHVCKVYSGNTMSRRIADRLTKLAISHKNKGIIYPEPVPVYRQLLIKWEEQG